MAGAALVFLLVASLAGAGTHLGGWGIPMPTDVALGLAALSLSSNPAAGRLRVFLLALAVADDVASVVVLAFVSHSSEHAAASTVALCWLGLALLIGLGLIARRRGAGPLWFLLLLAPMWWGLARIGIEPTLAGVAVGFLAPNGEDPRLPGMRLERVIAPLSAFVALPLFALLAAGVDLSAAPWSGHASLIVALVGARVIGKALGIMLAALLVVRLGFGGLPEQVRWRHLGAMGIFCGIGFTVSLLFADAAFGDQPALMGATKVALIGASVLCAVIGLVVMAVTTDPVSRTDRDPSDN
jgi:NhaA family Na+:H+ antiporter